MKLLKVVFSLVLYTYMVHYILFELYKRFEWVKTNLPNGSESHFFNFLLIWFLHVSKFKIEFESSDNLNLRRYRVIRSGQLISLVIKRVLS